MTTYVQVKMPDGTYELFEKGTEPQRDERRRVDVIGDLHYAETRGACGEDLSTRTKHREYLARTGYTTADDYKNEWAAKAAARDDFHRTGGDHKARRESIERAMYDHGNRR